MSYYLHHKYSEIMRNNLCRLMNGNLENNFREFVEISFLKFASWTVDNLKWSVRYSYSANKIIIENIECDALSNYVELMLALINIFLGRNGRQARENGYNRNLGLGICMDTLCYHGTLGHVLWFRQPLTNYGYHTSPLLQD